MGVDSYRGLLAEQTAVAAREHTTGEVEYMVAVSDDDTPALVGGAEPFAYYGTDRSASPGREKPVGVDTAIARLTREGAT